MYLHKTKNSQQSSVKLLGKIKAWIIWTELTLTNILLFENNLCQRGILFDNT